MATRRKSEPLPEVTERKPATTSEGREAQMVSLAVDRAEQRMRDGTASSMEIVHYLKLASSRERLEQERIAYENELLKAKTTQIASAGDNAELLQRAMKVFAGYRGEDPDAFEDEDD